jgi:short-subunit dehydrogenase
VKTALVTGASAGIGLELARVFAANGWNLVLVARSADKLAELAQELKAAHGTVVSVMPSDLALVQAPDDVFRRVQNEGIQIDALVNNAGIATHGKFASVPLAAELQELGVNIVALTSLSKLFLEPMIVRGSGYILNVASTAAFQPGPLMAVYYASKAYVLSLSEALAEETKGTGVSITALCPGATETGFQKRANLPRTRLYKRTAMDAKIVARAGYEGMLRRRTIVIPGLFNAAGAFMVRFAPRKLVTHMVRLVNSE